MIKAEWIKRRWLDFRNGHSIYLVFGMAFFQFTIITYALAIERLPVLKEIFPSMSYWIGVFVAVYVPAAVLIGHFHMKKQLPREMEQTAANNPHNFKTAPGKEQLFSLPITIEAYEWRIRTMELFNRQADQFEQVYNRPFPHYPKEEFELAKYRIEYARRLQQGEKVQDIEQSLAKP